MDNTHNISKKFEKWTDYYIKIRDKVAEIKERHDKELEPFNAELKSLQADMEAVLDQTGAQSIKTSCGTVYSSTRYTASLEDPQAFMNYVIENQKYDLLDRKANATAVRDFTEATGSLPPGAKLSAVRTLGVRRGK